MTSKHCVPVLYSVAMLNEDDLVYFPFQGKGVYDYSTDDLRPGGKIVDSSTIQ